MVTGRWTPRRIGSPLFPKLELKLPNGTFTIEAIGVSTENLYVQSTKLNGAVLGLNSRTARIMNRLGFNALRSLQERTKFSSSASNRGA